MNDTKNSLTGTYFAPGPLLSEKIDGTGRDEGSALEQTAEKKGLLKRFADWFSTLTIDVEYRGYRDTIALVPKDDAEGPVSIGFKDIDDKRREADEERIKASRKGLF